MAKQVKVYNTKTGKTHAIHPSFKNDKTYLAQRGLILVDEAKPMPTVTNLNQPSATETPKKQTTKTILNGN